MKDEKVYKGKRYSYGELSDKFEEVLFVWDSGADYVLFGDGKRFGLFRNSGFEMGSSPKYAYAIGEYLGYTKAYLFNMHAGARPEEYEYAYQCYLALGSKEKWIIYAFDLHSAFDVNNDDELPGVSVMAESSEGIGDAIEKLSKVIGIHIDRWFDLSTKDFTTLWKPYQESYDGIYCGPENYAEPSPDNIEELNDNQIFVFGSNLQGRHGGGAADDAMRLFGAVWGQGVGLQGHSYAIPTMHGPVEKIKPYVDEFLAFAAEHPELEFLVTRIGCGIAGFADTEIAPLFAGVAGMPNVRLPESFIRILQV